MNRLLGIGVVAFLALFALAMALPLLIQSRARADRLRCLDHLRQIGLQGLDGYRKPPDEAFPPGTVVVPELPPTERLGLYVHLLTPLGFDALETRLQRAVGWQAEVNAVGRETVLTLLLCPGAYRDVPPPPRPTSYVGLAGWGRNAAQRPITEAGAGLFRYDTPTPLADIADGLSQTLAFIETTDRVGPWLAGGPSTLRGVDTDATVWIGVGRAFGGSHVRGANVSLADGSARFLADTVSRDVLFALVCIAHDDPN